MPAKKKSKQIQKKKVVIKKKSLKKPVSKKELDQLIPVDILQEKKPEKKKEKSSFLKFWTFFK